MKTPPPPEWDGVEHLKSKSFGCPKMGGSTLEESGSLDPGSSSCKRIGMHDSVNKLGAIW